MAQGAMITPASAPRVKEIPRTTTVPSLRPPTPTHEPPMSSHRPDAATAVLIDHQREIEARAGVFPLDELQAEREHLTQTNSRIKAIHGPFGTYNDLRKIELAQAAQRVRAAWTGEKAPSEALVDSLAHADEEYVRWVRQASSDRAAFETVEDRITAITEMINRGQALLRYVSSEPKA